MPRTMHLGENVEGTPRVFECELVMAKAGLYGTHIDERIRGIRMVLAQDATLDVERTPREHERGLVISEVLIGLTEVVQCFCGVGVSLTEHTNVDTASRA